MNEESRIEALEHEVKILKNEIQSTLLEIREQILNHYYPELRAEEPVQLNSRSLPVRQPVGRPGLPAKNAPRPQEEPNSLSEIEAKGQVLPFSDIFLEDLSDDQSDTETNELVNSRRPVADLEDEFEDDSDDDFEDLMVDVLPTDLDNEPNNGNGPNNGNEHAVGKIKVQKVVPSSNAFGRAPQTREVDFRQLKQGGIGNKPAATPAPESADRQLEAKAETQESKAKAGRQNFAALATWVEDGV
jgi:hypothetical protein